MYVSHVLIVIWLQRKSISVYVNTENVNVWIAIEVSQMFLNSNLSDEMPDNGELVSV